MSKQDEWRALAEAWQEGYDTGWRSRDNYGDPDDDADYSNPYLTTPTDQEAIK